MSLFGMTDPDRERLRWVEQQAGVYDDDDGGGDVWEPDTLDHWERCRAAGTTADSPPPTTTRHFVTSTMRTTPKTCVVLFSYPQRRIFND